MSNRKLNNRLIYLGFTIIPVALYTFFYVFSVIRGIGYSFTDWDGLSRDYNLIGLKNYISLFNNPNFWNSLKTTVLYSIMLVTSVVVLSLLLALSLNSLKRFKTFVKSIFLPGGAADRAGVEYRVAIPERADAGRDSASGRGVCQCLAGSGYAHGDLYRGPSADSG